MYEFSIEQSANKINDSRTKKYFHEVMSSYFNSNYRSATVMLWTVVVCDVLYKLQFLKDIYNDKNAENILNEINELQIKEPTSPTWELELIKLVSSRTNLFEAHECDAIKNIQKHRHLSAHPVIAATDILFSPTREMTLADIRVALDFLLTKPPMLTNKIFDKLVEDLEAVKDLFPNKVKLKTYLYSKYFNNLKDELKEKLFKSLWRLTFKSDDVRCDDNREINLSALKILFEGNRELLSKYVSENSGYFSEISPNSPFRFLIFFLGDYPILYVSLSEAAREIIKAKVEKDIDLLFISYFLKGDIKKHIEMLTIYISEKYKNNFGVKNEILDGRIYDLMKNSISSGVEEEFYNLLILIYVNSKDFDAADAGFEKYIKPFYLKFSISNTTNLLEGINNNCQTYNRGRASSEHRLVANYAKTIISDYDAEKYKNLPK